MIPNQHKKISILGSGWLGKPLSDELEQLGYVVNCSTASDENYQRLKKLGKNIFQIKVRSGKVEGMVEKFLEADILIVNITPNRDELDQEQFASLRPLIEQSDIQKVLLISSTSVYPNINRRVSEDEKSENKTHHLYRSEQFLKESQYFETTVVRMAGLIGGERHPGRFFAQKGHIKNASTPINLIHRIDCIKIITELIKQGVWGDVFNACSDEHPLKKDFYPLAAKSIGLSPPTVEAEKGDFKIIDNQKLKERLNITLEYPDVMLLLKDGAWI